MLSSKVLSRKDKKKAADYYEQKDDYYSKDGDSSRWFGKGAEYLNLDGPVDPQRFRELLDGKIEPGGRSIRQPSKKGHKERIGLDMTFSAPKSVSMQGLIGGDERILQAHDKAVTKAAEEIERLAIARKTERGKARMEKSGNIVAAAFRHETSRAKDPQLHTHVVVMNLTRRSDGQWRALTTDEIVKANRYLGAVYRAELAKGLQSLGYELRHERDGMFELAHISRQQIEEFSQRTNRVNAELEAQGLSRETASTEKKQEVVMKTRQAKTAADPAELMRDWRERAAEAGIDLRHREPQLGREEISLEPVVSEHAARRAVRWAVNHLTERQAIIYRGELIDAAVKHGVGTATLPDVEKEIIRLNKSGWLIPEAPTYRPAGDIRAVGMTAGEWTALLQAKGLDKELAAQQVEHGIQSGRLVAMEQRYTTTTALSRERAILNAERVGRGAVDPILPAETARERLNGQGLTAGQQAAAELMLATRNRIVGVQGLAGSGKSHMLKTAISEAVVAGWKVKTLAPYGSQVKALKELGTDAHTLASYLASQDKRTDAKTLLIIDEAGVVPTRIMERTLAVAQQAGARVVLLGDTAQTYAIEAGKSFYQLQRAGMETARMTEIQRQRDPILRAAVELAAAGEPEKSLRLVSQVREIRDDSERRQAIADAYVSLSPAERDETLIVSGTNEARREINALVRQGLSLEGKGREYDLLVRRDTTQAERREAKYYRIGDMIQPERGYQGSGLERSKLYRVEDTAGNLLRVRDEDGEAHEFNPAKVKQLSVYERIRAELAVGDKVKVTRNEPGRKLDLTNGDRFTVAAIGKESITISDGKREVELPADRPLHLDHAYVSTIHGAQGLTADRVLIETQAKSLATARETYYVAISRARLEARIYTDNRAKLPEGISRASFKGAALELKRSKENRGTELELGA